MRRPIREPARFRGLGTASGLARGLPAPKAPGSRSLAARMVFEGARRPLQQVQGRRLRPFRRDDLHTDPARRRPPRRPGFRKEPEAAEAEQAGRGDADRRPVRCILDHQHHESGNGAGRGETPVRDPIRRHALRSGNTVSHLVKTSRQLVCTPGLFTGSENRLGSQAENGSRPSQRAQAASCERQPSRTKPKGSPAEGIGRPSGPLGEEVEDAGPVPTVAHRRAVVAVGQFEGSGVRQEGGQRRA